MTIHFSALPGVLFRPTETFSRLRADANLASGIKLYIIMMVLAIVIDIVLTSASFFASEGLREAMQWVYGDAWILIYLGLGLLEYVMGFVIFLFICGFAAKAISALSKRPMSFGAVTGMLSYTGAAFFLFLTLPLNILGRFLPVGFLSPMDIINVFSGMSISIAVVAAIILTILISLWELLAAGRAVATVHDTTWGNGILAVFLGIGMTAAIVWAVATLVTPLIMASYY